VADRSGAGLSDVRRCARKLRLLARRKLPPGLRLVVGLLLMVMGVFGFLPVLGFWMIPLGAAIAALDFKPIWKKLARR